MPGGSVDKSRESRRIMEEDMKAYRKAEAARKAAEAKQGGKQDEGETKK